MIEKEHLEFHRPDFTEGWHNPGYYPDGIEQKLAVHYYSRVACIVALLPLMERTAATNGADVRVLSVLSAGVHSAYAGYRDDPDLERSFSLPNAANAAGFYNDAALDTLARAHPTVTFAHAAPGVVATGWGETISNPILRGLTRGVLRLAGKSPIACAQAIGVAITAPEYRGGFRLVDANGRPARVANGHDAAREAIWAHTQEVLNKHFK